MISTPLDTEAIQDRFDDNDYLTPMEQEQLLREVKRQAGLLAKVREIHLRDEYGLCVACSWEYPETSYDAISNDVAWPCPTIRALDTILNDESEAGK